MGTATIIQRDGTLLRMTVALYRSIRKEGWEIYVEPRPPVMVREQPSRPRLPARENDDRQQVFEFIVDAQGGMNEPGSD
ncbi:MAG: hypothetical protein AAF674_16885 [Pseudomonadota bacterium]